MKYLSVLIACCLLLLSAFVSCGDVVNLQVAATEVAPMSVSITGGGETFYAIASVAAKPFINDRCWLVGAGGGFRMAFLSLDAIQYKVNDGLWTYDLNELSTLRLIMRVDVGRACVIGGLTLNRFVSTISDGEGYDTFAIRTGSHGDVKTRWWPGFVAGVTF